MSPKTLQQSVWQVTKVASQLLLCCSALSVLFFGCKLSSLHSCIIFLFMSVICLLVSSGCPLEESSILCPFCRLLAGSWAILCCHHVAVSDYSTLWLLVSSIILAPPILLPPSLFCVLVAIVIMQV